MFLHAFWIWISFGTSQAFYFNFFFLNIILKFFIFKLRSSFEVAFSLNAACFDLIIFKNYIFNKEIFWIKQHHTFKLFILKIMMFLKQYCSIFSVSQRSLLFQSENTHNNGTKDKLVTLVCCVMILTCEVHYCIAQ